MYACLYACTFGGTEQSVEVLIGCDDDEEISKFQRDTFKAIVEGWDDLTLSK